MKEKCRTANMMTEMTPKMRICMSTLQETSLDKEGMGLRKFGKSLLLFWREREREREKERERERVHHALEWQQKRV